MRAPAGSALSFNQILTQFGSSEGTFVRGITISSPISRCTEAYKTLKTHRPGRCRLHLLFILRALPKVSVSLALAYTYAETTLADWVASARLLTVGCGRASGQSQVWFDGCMRIRNENHLNEFTIACCGPTRVSVPVCVCAVL